MNPNPASALSAAEITSFIRDGFVRLDHAFSKQTAEEARAILWRATGCDPDDPSTWTRIRLDQFGQAPFREAANTPVLHFDQLVGQGRWLPLGHAWDVSDPLSLAGCDWRRWLAHRCELRIRDAGLHGVARQCEQSRTRVVDVVPVLGRRARRRADTHPGRIISTSRGNSRRREKLGSRCVNWQQMGSPLRQIERRCRPLAKPALSTYATRFSCTQLSRIVAGILGSWRNLHSFLVSPSVSTARVATIRRSSRRS